MLFSTYTLFSPSQTRIAYFSPSLSEKKVILVGYDYENYFSHTYREFSKSRCHENYVFIGPRCPWGPIYGSGSLSLRDVFADLTDVTLVDEDTKSILTDNADRAIQGNMAMEVTHPAGQLWTHLC